MHEFELTSQDLSEAVVMWLVAKGKFKNAKCRLKLSYGAHILGCKCVIEQSNHTIIHAEIEPLE